MYEVVWPRGKRTVQGIALAKRPNTLAGKTIAELWNGGFRGDEIFRILERELEKRYPGVKFARWEDFGRMGGAAEDKVLAELPLLLKSRGVDVSVGGVGC
ncbi:MAG TPA: hypothetical protein PLJ35_04315 [Anaerolineae bacterium]|nr:hypothetical protein [Anaerolineae bacterium]HOQ98027.1 hypothetical protein [Anaerolineae bacterium]HPL28528.1 hypothetical protein [Anaerolineae bacterium]